MCHGCATDVPTCATGADYCKLLSGNDLHVRLPPQTCCLFGIHAHRVQLSAMGDLAYVVLMMPAEWN